MQPDLALLRRDWRLYKGALLLPGLIATAGSLLVQKAGENPMTFLGISLLVALLVPHAIHLKEEHLGTLGDLRTLPVHPWRIVQLRVVEGSLLAFMVALLHVAMLIFLRGPRALQTLGEWGSPAWLWFPLCVLLLPLTVTLRWGSRGWLVLVGAVFGGFGLLVALGQMSEQHPLIQRGFRGLFEGLLWLFAHPRWHGLLLVLLCLLCLPPALAAYRRRDA